ncbi:hypothetical protein CCMA1212_001183 [Trichoderma ghanense]|uniref:Uncharacterized protein n=1 Tax=Trichoderma ghanense TaxID=65468 RepID=A0ABY2HH60_9HYPO
MYNSEKIHHLPRNPPINNHLHPRHALILNQIHHRPRHVLRPAHPPRELPPHVLLAQPVLPPYPLLVRLATLVLHVDPPRQHRAHPHPVPRQRHRHALRQPQQPGLGRRVRLVVRLAHDGPRRRHVHHAAPRRPQHVQARLRHQHRPRQVRLDAPVPLVQRHVRQPRPAHAARVRRIVHQAVQPAAEQPVRLPRRLSDLLRQPHVAQRGVKVVPAPVSLAEDARRVLQLRLVAVDEEDAVARLQQDPRQAAADAPPGSGDEERLWARRHCREDG